MTKKERAKLAVEALKAESVSYTHLQSKGYGRQALAMVLERIRQDKAHHRVYLSCNSDNAWGRALDESVGFRPDGRMVHGEIVYQLVWEP